MKALFISSAMLLGALPCYAQQNAIKVSYSPQIPAVARARMPEGSKSRFWGSCDFPSLNRKVFIHFYRLPLLRGSATRAREANVERGRAQRYIIDVFTKSGQGKRAHWQRLNSIRFRHQGYFSAVSADFLWVVPAQRRIPLLRFHIFNPDGFYSSGAYVLANFPQGLQGETVVQRFKYDNDASEVDNIRFNTVDRRGFTQVLQEHRTSHGYNNRDTLFRWNGREFK
jgi:hypothetical protein